MRRLGAVVLALVLCVLAVGCGGDAEPADASSSRLAGGYSTERDLTEADGVLFDKALGTMAGAVDYEPLKVATQLVTDASDADSAVLPEGENFGTNYRFYAKATVESDEPQPETYYVYVYIFVASGENAKPEVTDIVKTQ